MCKSSVINNREVVYIKFGKHHGKTARIVGTSAIGGEPVKYFLKLPSGEVIEKYIWNTVRLVRK